MSLLRQLLCLGLLLRAAAAAAGFSSPGCGTGEWGCLGAELGPRCIPLSKFCDGVKNCPDGSDEPTDCTNCNKTYSGKAGVKYPLRLTVPFQRFLPFVCRVTFVAMGGDFGEAVELSFLSFQIGRFEPIKSPDSACSKGYMKISEPLPTSQEDGPTEHPHFGSFCGKLSERSATYFSTSSNTSLQVVIPGRASIPTTPFSLFLTFRFLNRPRGAITSDVQYGSAVPGTFCDRLFLNCHRQKCRIRSPNFPGLYPRNVTCSYTVRQMQVPPGSRASISLHQRNDYKVSVGGESSGSPSSGGTTPLDCGDPSRDSLRVFDGDGPLSPLLSRFCGDGPVPALLSSGPQLLVQLRSAPYAPLATSRFELDVEVRFEPETAAFMQRERGRCAFVVDANRHRRSGVVASPRHTMPENSSCSYRFIGASAHDRLWIYFVSYVSRTKHSGDDDCDFGKLELFDSRDSWSMLDAFPLEYCGEDNTPRVCPHASDFPPSYTPGRPCRFPEESYLSSGPTFALKHTFMSTLDSVDMASYSSFVARYEFVDTRQDGVAIGRSECDRRFDSRSAKGGFISSPRNLFLYGRGGRQNLSCSFHFVGLPSERVRITILSVKLTLNSSEVACESKFDAHAQRHVCTTPVTSSSSRGAWLKGIEYWDSHSSTIGCLCNVTQQDRSRKVVFDSLVNNVKLVFSVDSMTAFEDFETVGFDAKFEFFNSTFCDTHVFDGGRVGKNPEGTIEFHVPHGRTNFTSGEDMLRPLRCRWQIKALTEKYLYLQFKGTEVTNQDSCREGLLVLVFLDTHLSQPSTRACVVSHQEVLKEYHVFSRSWYNDSYSIIDTRRDFIFIEIVGSHKWKGIKLTFHWMEVTKPFFRAITGRPLRNVDCVFECPEIGACISPHLWCDGVSHCPSGFDESPTNCHPLAKGMEYLSLIVTTAGLVLFVVALLIAWALIRHRHRNSSASSHDTEDRTKDYDHRLSPIEDFPMENHSS